MPKDPAVRIIDFIQTLRVPDGDWVGQQLLLRDWQKRIIRDVYNPRDGIGRRVVRQAVLSMGRKNGKTSLVAALCLAHLCGPEAVRNGQLYSLAFDREQASILFGLMANMVYMDEELSARLKIVESRKKIADPVSGSVFTALSGEKKGKYGKSSSFIAFDELAEFGSNRQLYDALITSTAAHSAPMVWVFSTQAKDDQSILSELIDYGEKVNAGEKADPKFKLFCYRIPEDRDVFDESAWSLANPAVGDFRSLDEMRDFAEKARQMPSAEATFRNLYCNQRVDSSGHFIAPAVWRASGAAPNEDAFDAFPVFGGLDLSGKNDLTALVLVAEDEERKIHVKCHFWTPLEGLRAREIRDRTHYCLWKDQGFLDAKPGRTIDYGWVARKLGEFHARYSLCSLRFDRWRIDDLRRELDDIGVEAWVEGEDEPIAGGIRLVPHGQGFRDMSPAVEYLEDALLEARLRHGNNPPLTMCASNVVIAKDPSGGRKFSKDRSTGRIDGIVALSQALTALRNDGPQADEPSPWDNKETAVM